MKLMTKIKIYVLVFGTIMTAYAGAQSICKTDVHDYDSVPYCPGNMTITGSNVNAVGIHDGVAKLQGNIKNVNLSNSSNQTIDIDPKANIDGMKIFGANNVTINKPQGSVNNLNVVGSKGVKIIIPDNTSNTKVKYMTSTLPRPPMRIVNSDAEIEYAPQMAPINFQEAEVMIVRGSRTTFNLQHVALPGLVADHALVDITTSDSVIESSVTTSSVIEGVFESTAINDTVTSDTVHRNTIFAANSEITRQNSSSSDLSNSTIGDNATVTFVNSSDTNGIIQNVTLRPGAILSLQGHTFNQVRIESLTIMNGARVAIGRSRLDMVTFAHLRVESGGRIAIFSNDRAGSDTQNSATEINVEDSTINGELVFYDIGIEHLNISNTSGTGTINMRASRINKLNTRNARVRMTDDVINFYDPDGVINEVTFDVGTSSPVPDGIEYKFRRTTWGSIAIQNSDNSPYTIPVRGTAVHADECVSLDGNAYDSEDDIASACFNPERKEIKTQFNQLWNKYQPVGNIGLIQSLLH